MRSVEMLAQVARLLGPLQIGDWMASADLEDLLSLVDGLRDFGAVVNHADPRVRTCLSGWARETLAHPDLDTLLDGNVTGPQRAARIARIVARLRELAAEGG